MVTNKDLMFIHTIGYPKDKELRGKVGYIRLINKRKDGRDLGHD